MQELVASVHRVSAIMAEILAASQEQRAGIEQINQAVTEMDGVTQQNAALVEEASAASGALRQQAAMLTGTIAAFTLDQPAAAAAAPPGAARQPAHRNPQLALARA